MLLRQARKPLVNLPTELLTDPTLRKNFRRLPELYKRMRIGTIQIKKSQFELTPSSAALQPWQRPPEHNFQARNHPSPQPPGPKRQPPVTETATGGFVKRISENQLFWVYPVFWSPKFGLLWSSSCGIGHIHCGFEAATVMA